MLYNIAMKELESWSDVVGYEGLYQVSNLGRVKSLGRKVLVKQDRYDKPRLMNWKGRILKPGIRAERDRAGCKYAKVILRKDGISKNHQVHRLVAVAFIDNPANKPVVNHIDCNGLNNNVKNLEWCTIAENNHHSLTMGNRKPLNIP